MKKIATLITALLALAATAKAMSYTQAREQALFLTDKMAYELNLNEEQYDAAYEVNLDYLMSIDDHDDLFGEYWRQRNLDLSYILLDWQYRSFCAAAYFYRPLYWRTGAWHFAIYSRYPRRNYFYFGRPNIYVTYRGGHGWRHNGGRSWYHGRTFNHGSIGRGHGMRDRFDRGDFGHRGHGKPDGRPGRGSGFSGDRGGRTFGKPQSQSDRWRRRGDDDRSKTSFGSNRGSFRSNRESSTRTTARPNNSFGSAGERRDRGFSKQERTVQRRPERTFSPRNNSSRSVRQSSPSRSFNNNRSSGTSRSKGFSSRGGSRDGGNFGGRR